MKIELKGILGILAAVLVAVGGVVYVLHQRASLREQGLPQVEEHVRSDISRRVLEEAKSRYLSPDQIAQLNDFEITEFRVPPIPRDQARVRVVVRTSQEEQTYYFRFKRVLGSWRLQREVKPVLGGW